MEEKISKRQLAVALAKNDPSNPIPSIISNRELMVPA
jgi:hypothetical protein